VRREKHIEALKLLFADDTAGSLKLFIELAAEFPEDTEIVYDLAMPQMMLGFQLEASIENWPFPRESSSAINLLLK
jgi:hypothetical protein